MCPITKRAGASLRPGDNVLVLCPSFRGDESRICLELLTATEPTALDALSVLFTRTPAEHLDAWERVAGVYPARNHVVSADADARSSTDATGDPGTGTEESVNRADCTVDRVGSPQNLTRLGVSITDCLDEMAETAPDRQITVCVQSVSTLLQYVEVPQAFKFLNVVTERCRATDAIAHYHLDPHAHDESTIETLVDLFDVVVEYEDGKWIARQ